MLGFTGLMMSVDQGERIVALASGLYCLDGQIDVKFVVVVTKVQTLEWWCCVVQCGEAGSPCVAVLC